MDTCKKKTSIKSIRMLIYSGEGDGRTRWDKREFINSKSRKGDSLKDDNVLLRLSNSTCLLVPEGKTN